MARQNVRIDYSGARGSNAGDEFHELWAVRQLLRLLDDSTGLTAVKLEGVPAIDEGDGVWNGVDCTLLFGGENLVDAKRLELHQLKYSAASPKKKWTVARACSGKKGNSQSSLIRRLADAFKALEKVRKGKPLRSGKITLVTNQPVAAQLVATMESARTNVPANCRGTWNRGDSDLHRLVSASGLSPVEFKRFASVLDFQSETGSRFALEDEMLRSIADWTNTEFRETASRLREYTRKRMLPEATADLITKEKVFIQFGVSDERALFPCPSEIQSVESPVSRGAAKAAVADMLRGERRICLHGTGGVGKTTALQEIEALLPEGSQVIVFDCYGAGSYQDASRLRHRPRDAFMQISNELARRFRLPMLLERNTVDPSRAFRLRLNIAAGVLERAYPGGLLVVAVDAADNSITAARAQTPPESSFVEELMSFGDLPSNVALILSTRTGRLGDLNPPSTYSRFQIPAFSCQETALNIARYWPAPDDWVEDFHHLSEGIPRVQSYAFEQAGKVYSDALNSLRPHGKRLDQIFEERFRLALRKSGNLDDIERVCAGLAVLPRPIPVAELAHVLNLPASQITDICTDLAPGIRGDDGSLSFADEDFEAYVQEKGRSAEKVVQHAAAVRALAHAHIDLYAASNVVPLLWAAGRGQDLLDLVEQEPEPQASVVADPIRRLEIRNQRLLTAIKVCREADNAARALRFVLIGAEALGSSQTTLSLLSSFPRLAIKYAKYTVSRLILSEPERVADHGRFLFHSLAEDAEKGDAVGVREGRRRLRAWLEARRDDYEARVQKSGHETAWAVQPEDAAALPFEAALLDGPNAAVERYSRFRPFGSAVMVGKDLVDQLLVQGRFGLAEEIAETVPSWQAVFVLVPLARAGRPIDLDRLSDGLKMLKRRFSLDARALGRHESNDDTGSYVIDTVLSGAEILAGHGVHTDVSTVIMSPFVDSSLRRIDKRRDFEIPLLDAILRSYCLKQALNGKEAQEADVLTAHLIESRDDASGKVPLGTMHGRDRPLKDIMAALTPIYAARAWCIVNAKVGRRREMNLSALIEALGRNEWQLDRNSNARVFRTKVAQGLTDLIAIGAVPLDVMVQVGEFCGIFRNILLRGARELCTRLSAIQELHDGLLVRITEEINETCRERIGGTDKSNKLAALADLLIPISSADANVAFQKAIEVAGELDFEVVDQLKLLDKLIVRGQSAFSKERRTYASVAAEIVNDAAIRLQYEDGFPWREAVASITRLDVPTALASVARWEDCQVARRSNTLPPLITVGLEGNFFSGRQAASLLSLDDDSSMELMTAVMKPAIEEGDNLASAIAEEFAHDSVVDRLPCYGKLEPLLTQHSQGEWATKFREQIEFGRTPGGDVSQVSNSTTFVGTEPSVTEAHVWAQTTLVDADKLWQEAVDLLKQSRSVGEHKSLESVLTRAGKAVLPKSRPAHLDALLNLLVLHGECQIVDVLLNAARDWSGQLSVEQWCKNNLPKLLVQTLPDFTKYLQWGDNTLDMTIEMAGLSRKDMQAVLLQGIERHVEVFDAGVVIALAGFIGGTLVPEEAASLSKWYMDRLLGRIPEKDREAIPQEALPTTAAQAVARFLYAYLGDVDLRLRWRAAHALRRLARLGESQVLEAIVLLYDRTDEPAFRATGAPFYWLAARLWLVIALDRIAAEIPMLMIPHGQRLLDICLSQDFPHMLVRDYAADACRKLFEGGLLTLSTAQMEALYQVNKGLPSIGGCAHELAGVLESHDKVGDNSRFPFDGLDTVPYWYSGWSRVFEGLTSDAFCSIVEEWIIDRWGVRVQGSRSLKEPRPQRFSDRSFRHSRNDHGAIPTLETYRNHLEWHGMWCAVGELLKTHRLKLPGDQFYESLSTEVSGHKLTHAPYWLSDLVGPLPLQSHRWHHTGEASEKWLFEIEDLPFLRELFPDDRPGWVVVGAGIETRFDGRQESVSVSTGLVSPTTAHALVRALQTAEDNTTFCICPEGHHLEIDSQEYVLKGWLLHIEDGSGFDDKDPYRNGIGPIRCIPGTAVTDGLRLERRGIGGMKWFREGADAPSFVFETWGQRERGFHPYPYGVDTTAPTGYRLLVRKEDLADFLCMEERDLIVDIGITRSDERRLEAADDTKGPKRVVFNRILLLRSSGGLEAAERCFDAWHSHCS